MPPATHLYLVRHGQSAGNAEGRFGGHGTTPLSELGRKQAQLTAKALAKERIQVIYSSDLHRALNAIGQGDTVYALSLIHAAVVCRIEERPPRIIWAEAD